MLLLERKHYSLHSRLLSLCLVSNVVRIIPQTLTLDDLPQLCESVGGQSVRKNLD